jgi:hypothetical protein
MLEILMNSQNEHGSAADTAGINSAMSRNMAIMMNVCFLVINLSLSGILTYLVPVIW